MMKNNQRVFSVGQVNSYIHNMFAQDYALSSISVKGEISNCKYHTSGHIYFTLKDEKSSVSCVMFAGAARKNLHFVLKEGMEVIVSGSIGVYERDGTYQLYADEISQSGIGNLYVEYERLKNELSEMGLFAAQYKKPIPKFARHIGIVTAQTGAAIRDIVNVATRRNPYVQLFLFPALVQGENASQSIVKGIETLDQMGLDCLIVGRGGGSIEDLWAFNEPEVAFAIFNCNTPIISAVGHETDTTIADYVADLRAPTPSAAAELAVFPLNEALDRLSVMEGRLKHQMENSLERSTARLREMEKHLNSLHPVHELHQKQLYLNSLSDRLASAMQRNLNNTRHRLSLLCIRLDAKSPAKRIGKGYVFAVTESGTLLESTNQIKKGDSISLWLKDGQASAKILSVEKDGGNT